MRFYLIAYDLRKPDYDCKPLYEELENYDATHVQESVWVLCSDELAGDILKALWRHMHSEKDRLLVAELKSNWAAKKAITRIKPLWKACRQ